MREKCQPICRLSRRRRESRVFANAIAVVYSSCTTRWIPGSAEDDGPMWPLRGLLAFSHRHISPQRRGVRVILLR